MDRSKWEYKKLGEVAKFIGGGTPSKANEDYYTGNIPWATVRDMVDFNLSKTELCITDQAVKESATNIIPKDTIIISTHVGLGKICLLMQDTAINQDLKGVILPQSIDKMFFAAWYKSIADYVISNGKGATVKGVTMKFVNDLKIPVPPVADQQRIVAELDCLNEMIALKQEQLKEFDKLAQSIFYDMFGDPMDNVHEWEISILEDVVSENCSISYGIVQPGDDVENGIPVVRPVDLVNQIVHKEELKIVDKAISDSYKRTILNGDELLFCVRGTTGIISFASEELKGCNVTRGITPLEFGDRIDKHYAFYLLKTPYLQSLIAEKTNGIALKQINMRDVRLLPIMCPPLALQQQFAEKIQAIEAQKELVKKSIAETQQLLDSRMDYYFN